MIVYMKGRLARRHRSESISSAPATKMTSLERSTPSVEEEPLLTFASMQIPTSLMKPFCGVAAQGNESEILMFMAITLKSRL